MYDVQELKQRLIIIKQSTLDDVTILNENYKQLIRNSSEDAERAQFLILRDIVQHRIKELGTKNVV